jgi:hypothetical protein
MNLCRVVRSAKVGVTAIGLRLCSGTGKRNSRTGRAVKSVAVVLRYPSFRYAETTVNALR